ncbi:mannitol dehydrogenase family protein [Pokkaliibacter sp. MBI-7]|uniref:mannitol dehydrogenase family protein n=1 Tax=Pokkaliibacter sp. MBI-7 TaxID=3040600 RepID=UPI00244B0092|nr:mannitol dehydrogenase family protein [Pokkaliibacter sp. MBI-7]MDH2434489.1 mannitol dehydrogenase family protein [Pokkaliibacter sp. MBI-7]
MKLNAANLQQLPASVGQPGYVRDDIRQGIVHVGVGGFHRAHQAVYTDLLLKQGKARDWGICGVGLRPEDRGMRDALASQDYLYTMVELGDSDDTEIKVIGAIQDFILAPEQPEQLHARLVDADTRIVSLTITEGGYCVDDSTGEFNAGLPQIQHDLANPDTPATIFGYLAKALRQRRDQGIPPFTIMSCDNLPHNGDVTRKAVITFTRLLDAELADWINANVAFPNAMVDRITPMTSAEHRQQLQDKTGVDDAWPVVCEPFIQWVLEDSFCNGRPQWEEVGVQFTDDVTPYEHMKLKLLNGSHLALTYLGYVQGYQFVHEAMLDPLIEKFVRDFMDIDVTPQLAPVPGINLTDYKQTLIDRFSNRAICDQLARTCSDGSAKFPKYIMLTVNQLLQEGKPLDRVALIIASWAWYLKGVNERGESYRIPDPRADFMQQQVQDDASLTQRFLGVEDIFGKAPLASAEFVAAFERALNSLREKGVQATLRDYVA